MKKKSHPNIPDFSKKKPSVPTALNPKAPPQPRAAAPNQITKPHSTSMKSGRRGS